MPIGKAPTQNEIDNIEKYIRSRRFKIKLYILEILHGIKRLRNGDRTGMSFFPGKSKKSVERKEKLFDVLRKMKIIPKQILVKSMKEYKHKLWIFW